MPASTSDPRFAAKHDEYMYARSDAIEQEDPLACGLACLVSVLKTWGVEATEEGLSEAHPNTGRDGYTLEELKAIAESRGLRAFVLQLNDNPRARLDEQIRQGRPVICAVRVPVNLLVFDRSRIFDAGYRNLAWKTGKRLNHFVVVCGLSEDGVLAMDPRVGLTTYRWAQFEEAWTALGHAALLVAR